MRWILSNNMNNNQQLQQHEFLKQCALGFVKQHEQQSTTSTTWNFKITDQYESSDGICTRFKRKKKVQKEHFLIIAPLSFRFYQNYCYICSKY